MRSRCRDQRLLTFSPTILSSEAPLAPHAAATFQSFYCESAEEKKVKPRPARCPRRTVGLLRRLGPNCPQPLVTRGSYPGDGQRRVEVLPALHPEAPGPGPGQRHRVRAHTLRSDRPRSTRSTRSTRSHGGDGDGRRRSSVTAKRRTSASRRRRRTF